MLHKALPFEEQETIINLTRGGEHATIYSSDSVMIRRLHKMAVKYPDDYVLTDEYPEGVRYSIPVRLLKFRNPPTEAMRRKGRELAQLKNNKESETE